MKPGFDFQALAARAHADNPDAELFDLIEADKGQRRRFGHARRVALAGDRERGDALVRQVFEDGRADGLRLRTLRPTTLAGLLAKLRHRAAKAGKVPVSADAYAALNDAIAWLDPPKPKRHAKCRGRWDRLEGDLGQGVTPSPRPDQDPEAGSDHGCCNGSKRVSLVHHPDEAMRQEGRTGASFPGLFRHSAVLRRILVMAGPKASTISTLQPPGPGTFLVQCAAADRLGKTVPTEQIGSQPR